jgi:hypothetical protein
LINDAVTDLRWTLNEAYDLLPDALNRVLAERLELERRRLVYLAELLPAWVGAVQRGKWPDDVGAEYIAGDWFVVDNQPVWRVQPRGDLAKYIRQDNSTASTESSDIEIAIYLDQYEEDVLESVERQAMALASSLGYEDFAITEELKGSIFRRWSGKLKDGTTSEFVQKRLAEVDQSLTIYTVAKAQAEVDSLNTASVANLIASLADEPNAVAKVGALAVIKYTDEAQDPLVFVRTLSALEIRALEKSPGIQRDPRHFFELLASTVYEISMDEENRNSGPAAIES